MGWITAAGFFLARKIYLEKMPTGFLRARLEERPQRVWAWLSEAFVHVSCTNCQFIRAMRLLGRSDDGVRISLLIEKI